MEMALKCGVALPEASQRRLRRGGLERVLVKKIGSDQAALRLAQRDMRIEGLFHLRCARLEKLQQIPVTAVEVFEHLAQLPRGVPGLEPKNPADDMVGPRLIRGVEVSRFSRRFERPYDDPGRIWVQMQGLPVQEVGLRQGDSLSSFVE